MIALELGGWLAASAGLVGAAGARRALAGRMEIVARACHELRAPLTAARLGLDYGAGKGELTPARLRAIDLELGRAALVLDDLDAVRSRRVWSRPPEAIDLRQLVSDSVEAWRPTAAAHGVELRASWSGDARTVWGDRLRLAQVTGNLIANAIEHGGGVVEVHGHGDRMRACVEVSDTGPGLPAPVAELARGAGRRRGRSGRPWPRGRRGRSWPRGPRGRRGRSGRPWPRGRRGRRGRRGQRGRGLAIAAAIAADQGGRLAAAPSPRGARLVLELPAGRAVARQGSPLASSRVGGGERAEPPWSSVASFPVCGGDGSDPSESPVASSPVCDGDGFDPSGSPVASSPVGGGSESTRSPMVSSPVSGADGSDSSGSPVASSRVGGGDGSDPSGSSVASSRVGGGDGSDPSGSSA